MSLCFIEPQNAIRVIANSIGREARRQLLGEVVRAWVDEIPEADLVSHYAKAVADLSSPVSPLLLASPPEGWDHVRDTRDGTHPSVRGEHRIAAAFADAMHQAWEVGGPYAHRAALPPGGASDAARRT